MENGIKLTTEGAQETVVLMAAAIDAIFESAFKNHVPAEVQLVALEALKASGSINGTTISNCSLVDKQMS